MSYVTLEQGTIHYTDDGPRDAPVIVLLHGALVDGRLWRKVVPLLAATHRVVVPDLPLGCHRKALVPEADRTPAGIARLVADLLECLDLEDVLLAGNDSGGALAQLVAADHPERIGRLALISCDAFEGFPPGVFGLMRPLARYDVVLRAVLAPMRFRAFWRLPMTFGGLAKRPIDPAIMRAWGAAMRADRGVQHDIAVFWNAMHPRTTLDVATRLWRFTRPVLVLWAREDQLFPPANAERLAALFDDARVAWIEDSYAFVSEDQPEATARELLAFASATTSQTPAGSVPAGIEPAGM